MPERAPYGTDKAHDQAPRKPGLAEAYASLEALLTASPRGRWFLAEYARRNRSAETELLREAQAEGLKQDDVDRMMREARGQLGTAASATPNEAGAPSASPAESRAGFERPKPLSLAELDAVKRAAQFG